ncbi:MAG: Zn-dependent hydrolase [Chlamydiae bacterium CG10_big_fil_rev_8_21_14_0_10_35_9]|nr:MAG: Zn-dependent hydrolase [Chlamydiae bacterium CG10_big_fil_rev_8_21_14_0_10_35_9]
MKGFCSFASGSKGNCIYLATTHAKILIDAGISARMIEKKLNEVNVDISEIDAIIVTHEHSDHIQGLKVLAAKKKIPVFCNADTARGICDNLRIQPNFKIFTTGEPFTFKDLEFKPFTIPHDTLDPVGFTVQYDRHKLGFCTDLGFVTTTVIHSLQNCDYLFLEANHHPDMVMSSPRSPIYKRRVLGRQGHLSNMECAKLIDEVFHAKLKHIHLAHLSSECNHKDLAYKTVKEFLEEKNKKVDVSVALQDATSKKIYL